MFGQEVYLTTFEMMHTYGFIKIMSIIWGTVIVLGVPVIYILIRLSRTGK